MSSLIQQALLTCRTPLTQFQRFRVKINIQRPKKPHYERAKIIEVTKPQYVWPPKKLNCFQPKRYKTNQVENPYNNIIAREVHNWFEHSRLVAIFHMNSISSEDVFRVRVDLHKQNMHLKSYGRKIMIKALENTRYEATLPLCEGSFYIVFSTEARLSQLLRITKKVPQMILLGGILENRLLSRNEMVSYAQHPGLQAAQAELVQTLNMAAGNLVQQLEAHQNNFVNILDVYAKNEYRNPESTTNATTDVKTDNIEKSS